MKYFVDCSNLSCSPDRMLRTGIQEVVYRILLETTRLRHEFPDYEILTLPALPSWPFPWRHKLIVPHFNLPPGLCEEIEDELNLPSKEIWGVDLRSRGFKLPNEELTALIQGSDRCLLPSIMDISPVAQLNPNSSVILHDFTPFVVPEYTSLEMAEWMPRNYYPSLYKHAKKIFSVSRNTALEAFVQWPEKNCPDIITLPLAFPKPHSPKTLPSDLLKKYGLEEGRYVAVLGSMEPRKYILGSIEGFDRFCELYPKSDLKLVQIGGTGWKNETIVERIERSPFKANILRTGYIDDPDLSTLLSHSGGLLMLSQYEGFGIPVAMGVAHRIPVITTFCSSLPEACAGAAIFVDSFNPESVALGIHQALTGINPSLSSELNDLLEHWTWTDYVRALHQEVLR